MLKTLLGKTNKNAATEKKIIVVLGAPTNAEGGPGTDLKQRLDRCLEMIQKGNGDYSYVAVTGGNPPTYGSAGTVREGRCMRDYLISHGLGDNRIIVEDQAAHTFHNALYIKSLLRQRGELPATVSSPLLTLVVLTTDWHGERSLRCFKAVFCDVPKVALKLETVPSEPNSKVVREKIAKEERLIDQWVPWCIEGEKKHPDMAPVIDAMVACRERQNKWFEISCQDGSSVFLSSFGEPSCRN